jgi:EAL domain-containing protein (putative c-di-GMP-specific phosphodiesterase class I)
MAVLETYRANEFAISIDDFGAGYTSLGYLRNFSVAELKIDQLFIRDLAINSRDAAIVQSIAVLGQGFGIRVVAEGVEDVRLWSRLRELGCEYGQGYSIAQPMPAAEFDAWLKTWPGAAHPGLQQGYRPFAPRTGDVSEEDRDDEGA